MITLPNHHTLLYLHKKLKLILTDVNHKKTQGFWLYIPSANAEWFHEMKSQKQMVIKLLQKYKSPKDQKPYFYPLSFRSLALTIIAITMAPCLGLQYQKC